MVVGSGEARRSNSLERTFASLAWGFNPTRSCCSTTMQETEGSPTSMASASPTGPAPAMRTSVTRSVTHHDATLH